MNTKYIDLIDQSFNFPQQEFKLEEKYLHFHDIDLMALVEEYDTPLKFTYLPQISNNIQRAKTWFADAFKKYNYKGNYNYCYCTKSSHFKHVINVVIPSSALRVCNS